MTNLKLPGYKNLKVWQMGFELSRLVYQATRKFPNGHYRLIDQMVGSSTSVYGNIGEGYCKNSLPHYVRACDTARGELGELIGYIHFCEEEGLIKDEMAEKMNVLCNNLWPALGGLIASLQRKLEAGEWDNTLTSPPES